MTRIGSGLFQVFVAGVLVFFVTTGVLFVGRHQVLQWQLDLPEFSHQVGERRSTWVEMRDGVKLSTQVILPKAEGPFPVVIIRNPYNLFDAFTLFCETFARYGYACVHQDVRGRMGSEGEWVPMLNERNDGLDLLAWLREQDFQDGHWGLWGMSYLAAVQWAMADALPPEVKTMVSMVFSVDSYRVVYEGGLFRHDVFSAWAALMPNDGLAFENGWAYSRMIRHQPAREADEACLGQVVPWYRNWVDAPRPFDSAWKDPAFVQFREAPEKVQVPVLMFGAYYDPFIDGQVEDFRRLATRPKSKLVIGPWQHLQLPAADVALEEDLGFGGQWRLFLDWMDHHLKGYELHQAVGVVETYDPGLGGWHQRLDFPPAHHQSFRLRLTDLPGSATCTGGRLSGTTSIPQEGSVSYVYDPEDPTPSVGGASALSFAFRTFPSVEPGALVQPEICDRPDVLSFVTRPLNGPIHLAGRVKATLQVSTDAEDTAFGIELMAKAPGSDDWVHVREGYRTLAFRAGSTATVTYTPGEVVTVPVETFPIEWTFEAGTQLRVDVRSASFPLYAAHPNVAGRWGAVKTRKPAWQSLHTGSFIDLPVRVADRAVLSRAALGTVPAAMACSFKIDVPGGAADIVDKAKKMIEDASGSFSGDAMTGNYKIKLPVGAVEGKYTVSGESIGFEITKKPMLVPCSAIESFLRDRLKSA